MPSRGALIGIGAALLVAGLGLGGVSVYLYMNHKNKNIPDTPNTPPPLTAAAAVKQQHLEVQKPSDREPLQATKNDTNPDDSI